MRQDNINMAAAFMQRVPEKDAEWFFLMGEIYYEKGWYDEAGCAYAKACRISPEHKEYKDAMEKLKKTEGYENSPEIFRFKDIWKLVKTMGLVRNKKA